MSTLAERFAAAATLAAMELPGHRKLHNAIDAIANPGLSAATYEARVSGGTSTSHPERSIGLSGWDADDDTRHRGVKVERIVRDGRDAQIRAARAYTSAWDAVCTLNAVIVIDGDTRGEPVTWSDVVKDAHLIAELNGGERLQAELDVDEGDVSDAVRSFVDAIGVIRELWGEWTGHAPSIGDQVDSAKACLAHAGIGGVRPRYRRFEVCKYCYDTISKWAPGEVHLWHRDGDAWPTKDMLRALESGHMADLRRETAEYLRTHGARRAG